MFLCPFREAQANAVLPNYMQDIMYTTIVVVAVGIHVQF